jgi:hypothetical protein
MGPVQPRYVASIARDVNRNWTSPLSDKSLQADSYMQAASQICKPLQLSIGFPITHVLRGKDQIELPFGYRCRHDGALAPVCGQITLHFVS